MVISLSAFNPFPGGGFDVKEPPPAGGPAAVPVKRPTGEREGTP